MSNDMMLLNMIYDFGITEKNIETRNKIHLKSKKKHLVLILNTKM